MTLSVDGATTKVSTFSGTVGEVLEDRGVRVSSRDVVAPAPGTKITDGTRIAVQYGRQVKLKVDGEDKTFWTTATTVGDALEVAGIDSAGAALSTSRSSSIGRQGVDLKVATEKAVVINAAGRKRVVQTTAQTVGGALAAAKITVDGNDLLSAKKTAKLTDGTRVTYTKVDVRTVTKKRAVDFPTVRKNTSSLTKGLSRVDTTGKDGVRTTTYRQTLHNGTVKVTERTTSVITTKPRARVILVGTKELPPPAPRKSSSPANKSSSASNSSSASRSSSSSSRSSSSSSRSSGSSPSRSTSSPSVASGSVWDRLAQCEAGGNWSINTGNGFYGGLQFTLSTWRGHGGSGMPHHASREAQIAVAKRVQANQGWGAWPACTSKLGIR